MQIPVSENQDNRTREEKISQSFIERRKRYNLYDRIKISVETLDRLILILIVLIIGLTLFGSLFA
jgi:hypothetical protein